MTAVVTDCGHEWESTLSPEELSGCTTDCRVCDTLLIFPTDAPNGPIMQARGFHAYMHEQNEQWPSDGAGTGWVELG